MPRALHRDECQIVGLGALAPRPIWLFLWKKPRPLVGVLHCCKASGMFGFGTLAGIEINHKTEVTTKDFEVIPGLYAAGSDANNLYRDIYLFRLPGITLGFALNSGRIAGKNAAEFVKSLGN